MGLGWLLAWRRSGHDRRPFMAHARTFKYAFLVTSHPGACPVSLGERRASNDDDAKRVAAIELRNEESRHGLGPAAVVTIRRADGSMVGEFDCAKLLGR